MFAKTTLLFAALQASLAVAGNAIISNRCSYDIWYWTVNQGGSSSAVHVPAGSQHSEPFASACDGCGTSVKISKTNQLQGGKQTQFEYSIVNKQLWFDISFVDCASGQSADNCPGHAEGLSMTSPNKQCGQVSCAAGTYCPSAAYYVPQPMLSLGIQEPVFTCPDTSADLVMTTCSGKSSAKRSIAGRVLIDA